MEIFGLRCILFCEKTMVLHQQLNDKKLREIVYLSDFPAMSEHRQMPLDCCCFPVQHGTSFMYVWSRWTVLCGGMLSKHWLRYSGDDVGDDMDHAASPFSVSQPGIY